MTNERRALMGKRAVDVGTPDRGQNDERTDAIDTVANVLHYLGSIGVDDPVAILSILSSAATHYLAESDEDEPAYTVIGLYRDEAGGRFAETFYTRNGPSAAEELAKTWAGEQGEDVSPEDIVIAAVLAGEARVIA